LLNANTLPSILNSNLCNEAANCLAHMANYSNALLCVLFLHCFRALLSEERRAASCVATSDSTVCLSLSRDDFDRMLGSLSDALARRAGIERSRTEMNVTSPSASTTNGSSSVSPKGWLLLLLTTLKHCYM
jgi:hypothetical protein